MPLALLAAEIDRGMLGVMTMATAMALVTLGIAVGFGLSALLGPQDAARGVFIIQCAMPVAVINYVFAARYNRDPAAIASLVVISTLVSFASLPVLMLLVLA